MNKMQRLAGALVCGIMAAVATVSQAAQDEVVSVEVRYGELDLAKTAGAEVFYRRLKHATRTVCGSLNPRSASSVRVWNDCYQETLETAVAAANRPILTALHQRQMVGMS